MFNSFRDIEIEGMNVIHQNNKYVINQHPVLSEGAQKMIQILFLRIHKIYYFVTFNNWSQDVIESKKINEKFLCLIIIRNNW